MKINRSVKADNEKIAGQNRSMLSGIKAVNIMGSPGSGKTTLIENIAKHLDGIAVIQGDLESDIDKRRMENAGIQCFQINTHSACHLNAKMVHDALSEMNLEGVRYLFIENVGNLVCPTGVDLGQSMNIVVSSTTEGSDKPQKYPIIFRTANAVVVSKIDLAQYVDFSLEQYEEDLARLTPAPVFVVTSRDAESFKEVASLIETI